MIVPVYQQGETDAMLPRHLERLLFLAEDTRRRLVDTK